MNLQVGIDGFGVKELGSLRKSARKKQPTVLRINRVDQVGVRIYLRLGDCSLTTAVDKRDVT